jgi:hypothetical protein
VVARSNSRVDLGAGLAGGHLNDPHEVEFNRPAGAESTTRPARSQPSCHSPDHMYLADGTAFSRRSATVVRRNVPSSKPTRPALRASRRLVVASIELAPAIWRPVDHTMPGG